MLPPLEKFESLFEAFVIRRILPFAAYMPFESRRKRSFDVFEITRLSFVSEEFESLFEAFVIRRILPFAAHFPVVSL